MALIVKFSFRRKTVPCVVLTERIVESQSVSSDENVSRLNDCVSSVGVSGCPEVELLSGVALE